MLGGVAELATPRSGEFGIRLSGIRPALAITVAIAVGAVAVPLPRAAAQQVAPSQVTPRTLVPAAPPSGSAIALPAPAGLTPPENADRLFVRIGRVEVDGTFPGFEQQTAAIVDKLSGQHVSVAQIYDVANELEQAYATAGYFLGRVVIPPQQLTDGRTLHLSIIDGIVERIDVREVPERQRALVLRMLSPLIGVPYLKLAEIERRLLLLSDLPGLRVRSTLTAGNTAAGTLIVLQGTQSYVTGTLGFDNHLPASLGTYSINASAALNSIFGLGEQIYGSASSTPDFASPKLRVLGGGIVLPIGNDGFSLNPEYTNSVARPTPVAGTPATEGDFQRVALRANYPVIRTRAQNLVVQGSLEWLDETLTPIGFTTQLYHDDYAAARFHTIYTFAPQADLPVQVSGTISRGLAGREATAALPLSRVGASPTFTSADLEVSAQHPLPGSLVWSATARGQTSFDSPLVLSEQFSLDGPTAVSAFASGTFTVDQGATLRQELSRPFSLPFAGQNLGVSPYVFGAGGWGELVLPTAVEHRDLLAGAAGFGMRTDAAILGMLGGSLIFEFARKFSDVPAVPSGYRANLSVSLRF